MKDFLLEWIETVDWNVVVETLISYSYLLYYLPFPIIAIGTYFFLKSLNVPSVLLRILSSILVTIGVFYYHQKHVSLVAGEVNFQAMEIVAFEFIGGALLCLVTMFIFILRFIYSSIKKLYMKKKPL